MMQILALLILAGIMAGAGLFVISIVIEAEMSGQRLEEERAARELADD